MMHTTVALADLVRAGGFARLQAAASERTALHIDCAGAPRLPAAFIAAALAAGGAGATLHLEGLAGSARKAVEAIDHAGVLALGGPLRVAAPACERPFSVELRGDQLEVRVFALARGARMSDPAAHEWLRGVSCAQLAIDLAPIEHLDSLLVAWLLQLSQAAAPAKVTLLRVSAQVATQLRQLRLNHIMAIA